jgi:hypothetical protein
MRERRSLGILKTIVLFEECSAISRGQSSRQTERSGHLLLHCHAQTRSFSITTAEEEKLNAEQGAEQV